MRIGKVYKDIEKSDYRYCFHRFTFYFSSKLYIDKFDKELHNYIKSENEKISKKYPVFLYGDEFLALSLYKKIEKRGFRVYYESERIDKDTNFTISPSYLKYLKG